MNIQSSIVRLAFFSRFSLTSILLNQKTVVNQTAKLVSPSSRFYTNINWRHQQSIIFTYRFPLSSTLVDGEQPMVDGIKFLQIFLVMSWYIIIIYKICCVRKPGCWATLRQGIYKHYWSYLMWQLLVFCLYNTALYKTVNIMKQR